MVVLIHSLTFGSVILGDVDSRYTVWPSAHVLANRNEYIITRQPGPDSPHIISSCNSRKRTLFIEGKASQMIPKPIPSSYPDHSVSYPHVLASHPQGSGMAAVV